VPRQWASGIRPSAWSSTVMWSLAVLTPAHPGHSLPDNSSPVLARKNSSGWEANLTDPIAELSLEFAKLSEALQPGAVSDPDFSPDGSRVCIFGDSEGPMPHLLQALPIRPQSTVGVPRGLH